VVEFYTEEPEIRTIVPAGRDISIDEQRWKDYSLQRTSPINVTIPAIPEISYEEQRWNYYKRGYS